jgi:hypothetical protein
VGRLYFFLPLGSFTPSHVNTYRGILERVIGDEDDNGIGVFVRVVPVDPDAPPDDDRNRVAVPLDRVIRQSVPWTLRFDVGDDVVVHSNDGVFDAKVERRWPLSRSIEAHNSGFFRCTSAVRWMLTTTTTRCTRREGEPLAVRQRVTDVEALQMSADEWRLAGRKNAEAAEEDAAAAADPAATNSFLVKAIHCFEQADQPRTSPGPAPARCQGPRATVQRAVPVETCPAGERRTRARREKADTAASASAAGADLESSTAQLLLQLFRDGLWAEASGLRHAALPYLPEYAQDRLRADVLTKLPAPYS